GIFGGQVCRAPTFQNAINEMGGPPVIFPEIGPIAYQCSRLDDFARIADRWQAGGQSSLGEMLPLGPQQEARRRIDRLHSSPQELLKRGREIISRPDLHGDEHHAEASRHLLRGLPLPGVGQLAAFANNPTLVASGTTSRRICSSFPGSPSREMTTPVTLP